MVHLPFILLLRYKQFQHDPKEETRYTLAKFLDTKVLISVIDRGKLEKKENKKIKRVITRMLE